MTELKDFVHFYESLATASLDEDGHMTGITGEEFLENMNKLNAASKKTKYKLAQNIMRQARFRPGILQRSVESSWHVSDVDTALLAYYAFWRRKNPTLLVEEAPHMSGAVGCRALVETSFCTEQWHAALSLLVIYMTLHSCTGGKEWVKQKVEDLPVDQLEHHKSLIYALNHQRSDLGHPLLGIWVHSNQPFALFTQAFSTEFAIRWISHIRKALSMPTPMVGSAPPIIDESQQTITSCDGKFVLGIGEDDDSNFLSNEYASAFYHWDCYDFILKHGHRLTITEVVAAEPSNVLALEDNNTTTRKRKRPSKLTKKPYEWTRPTRRMITLVRIGQKRMLTQQESTELWDKKLIKNLRESRHPILTECVSYFVPANIWRRASDKDRELWAQRTVEHGPIPATQFPVMMQSHAKCKSHSSKRNVNGTTPNWWYWNPWDEEPSYAECFVCQARRRRAKYKRDLERWGHSFNFTL